MKVKGIRVKLSRLKTQEYVLPFRVPRRRLESDSGPTCSRAARARPRIIRLLQAKLKRKHDVAVNAGDEQAAPIRIGPGQMFPDLVLTSQDKAHRLEGIIEVETGESVNHLEAMAQWAHFGRVRTPFYLYVPAGAVDIARRLCTENGVAVSEIWCYHSVGDQTRFTLVQRVASQDLRGPGIPGPPGLPAAKPRPEKPAARPAAKAAGQEREESREREAGEARSLPRRQAQARQSQPSRQAAKLAKPAKPAAKKKPRGSSSAASPLQPRPPRL